MEIGIREIEQKYELVAKLGEGGMGSVYQARHLLLDEMRVIKTIKPQLSSDEDLQKRFLREAQVAAKMSHPHIAALHDFAFTDDGTAYIVMQHVAGQNLRDYQRQGGRLTLDQVLTIGNQALSALGYLHGKQFVHRDISTDNLMLGWVDGKPWVTLIDLGLAKSLEGSEYRTQTGMVVGKVRYISPEQLNSGVSGVEVDARSDLYSFGVVLYELLTGEYPITGADDMSLIAGHLYRPPRPFDETDPGATIPGPLRGVVMRSLEKKPDYRFASAEEFAAALESVRHVAPEIDTGMQPTVALSSDQITSARQGQPGDPFRATETLGVQVSPQVTQPALAPEDVPFTRPNVPQPGGAPVDDTRPVGDLTQPVGQPTRPVRAEPRVAGEGPTSLDIDHEAQTAPISVTDLPASSAGSRPRRPKAAGAGTSGAGRSKALLVAVALVVLAACGWWFLGRGDLPASSAGDDARGGTEVSGASSAAAGNDSDTDAAPIFYGKYHALVIGNNAYQKLPPLDMALHDARAVARVLEDRYDFEVTLIENADRATLSNALWETASALTGRDNLLVYYAGHGAISELESPYWQPVDADPVRTENWISTLYDVSSIFDRLPVKHVLVVADSCFAGATGSQGNEGGVADPQAVAEAGPDSESIRDLVRRPSRMVLASGGVSPVLDAGDGRHSIFARALLDALESNEGPLSASALFRKIAPRVGEAATANDFEQAPTLAPMPSSKDEGGELFFVPSPSETSD